MPQENEPRADLLAEQEAQEADEERVQQCNCPHDYCTHYIGANGQVCVERHNDWCPASTRYIPRFHWHERTCYDSAGRCVCGKQAGVSLR